MRQLAAVILGICAVHPVSAQTYTIKTFAGSGLPNNVAGTSTGLGAVAGMAVDAAGNAYFTSARYQGVLRLDATTGFMTVVAGNGVRGFGGDNGLAVNAQVADPQGLSVDASGSLYIADTGNNRIRKVANGVITTVAGGGTSGLGDNGPASGAQLSSPQGVAVDTSGNVYIADTYNSRIRKVVNGVITTIAGGTSVLGDNGPAQKAGLSGPTGVALDAVGNIYIADFYDYRVREISNGIITTIAGNGIRGFSGDNGPATSAQMEAPNGICVDAAGSVYFSDQNIPVVRRISNGVITTVAGVGSALYDASGFSGDNGPATSARLSSPTNSVAVDAAGNLFIADSGNNRVRKVAHASGTITTVAGDGTNGFGGDAGPATSAQLSMPNGVGVDQAGNVYIADTLNNRIRKVSNGTITTIAGNGIGAFSGDGGPAIEAGTHIPSGIAVDARANVYFMDDDSAIPSLVPDDRVRRISGGVITTIASSYSYSLSAIASDAAGNVYFADDSYSKIYRLVNGFAVPVVGDGENGTGGDNGPPTGAELSGVSGIAVDSTGTLYIADTRNNHVRKVAGGVITTVAGVYIAGYDGDNGPADEALLSGPTGVAVDGLGNLYIADTGNQRIRKISSGVITTIAGNGVQGLGGDNGPATSAQLNSPVSLAVDTGGNVYVADGNRIRVLVPSGPSCTVSLSTTSLMVPAAGGTAEAAVQAPPSCAWNVERQFEPPWISYLTGSLGTGSATVRIAVEANTGGARWTTIPIGGIPVTLNQQGVPGAPGINEGGVVPVYSTGNTIAPGSWISIYGTNLAPQTAVWNNDFPTTLGGVTVTINGKPGYLWFVSPGQINMQAPDDLIGATDTPANVQVVVTTPSGTATAIVFLAPYAPAFSLFDNRYAAGVIPTPDGSGAYQNGTYDLLGPPGRFAFNTRPVKAGEILVLYGVGFGYTLPFVPAGQAFSGAAPIRYLGPTVMIDGVPATVLFAGITSAGLYQFNVVVPSGLASGDHLLQTTLLTPEEYVSQDGIYITVQ